MTYTATASEYWPAERIERMMQLIGEGMGARQIGERLGVSHRALLAKCSRMGIPVGRPSQEWPEERLKRLRELALMDLTSSQIGAALGITKNAALGKMHREGIAVPRPKNPHQRVKNGRERPQPVKIKLYDDWRKPRQTASRGLGYAVKDPAVLLPPGLQDLPLEAPTGFAVDIMGLTPTTCRWPQGEPTANMLYCGATIVAGSYCPFHTMRAFRPRGAPDDRHTAS